MLERAVEEEYRPRMRAELQRRLEVIAETTQTMVPACPRCGQSMRRKDTDRFHGWRVLDVSRRGLRVTVALAAASSAGRYWMRWVWNRGASVVRWRVCWRCWQW
jgi:hypothetical protein